MSAFIPNYTPEIEAMHQKLQEATERVVREHQIAIDGLTEKQVAEAFKQAVLAGDFQKVVVATSPEVVEIIDPLTPMELKMFVRQNVNYIPFREVETLTAENARLRKILEERGIDWKPKIEEEA